MPESLEKIRKFVKELQHSDRQRKKKWLIGLTALAMIVVLILWSVYINTAGLPALAKKNDKPSAQTESRSTWEVFRQGLSEIFNNAKNQLELSKNLIQEQFQKTNEIIIDATSTATSTNATTTNL